MGTCVIFGAGASLANAQYFHSERYTDKNPPLDTTFFKKIRALKIPVSRSIYANKVLGSVDVVNPDPNAAARYARLVPNKPLRWFPDVYSLWR